MMTSNREERFELEDAIKILTATPGTLATLLGDLQDSWIEFKEEPEAWSPRTVLVHYIHNELTNWMPRVRVTLSDSQERRFPPFQQLPDLSEYEAYDLGQLLAKFADLRQQNLSELQNFDLGPADYSREAEHPVLGTVNLRQLLASWVVHHENPGQTLPGVGRSLAAEPAHPGYIKVSNNSACQTRKKRRKLWAQIQDQSGLIRGWASSGSSVGCSLLPSQNLSGGKHF
jgi:hypothetical protein